MIFKKIVWALVKAREEHFVKKVNELRRIAEAKAEGFYIEESTAEAKDLDEFAEPEWSMEICGRRIYLILSYNADFDGLATWERSIKKNFAFGRMVRRVRVRNWYDIRTAFIWLHEAIVRESWRWN